MVSDQDQELIRILDLYMSVLFNRRHLASELGRGEVDQRKVAYMSPGRMATYVMVGLPIRMPPCSKSPFISISKGEEAKNKKIKSINLNYNKLNIGIKFENL